MLSRLRFFTTLLAAMAFANIAVAATLAVDVPEFVGAPEFFGVSVPFDIRGRFDSIESISLLIEARTTPLVREFCGFVDDPMPCQIQTIPIPIFSGLAVGPFGWRAGFFDSSGETFTQEAAFSSRTSIEEALSGSGSISLGFGVGVFQPREPIVNLIQAPEAEVFSATLIVRGSTVPAIPEPGAAAMFALGLVVVWLGSARKRAPAA